MLGFAADVAQIQLAAGGHLVFEQMAAPPFWQTPKLAKLRNQLYALSVPLCSYGLVRPDGVPLQKSLRLLVSHAHMRSLSRACPGHDRHYCPAGSHTSLGKFAMQYPPGFVRSLLRTVKTLARTEALLVQAGTDRECLVAARVQQLYEQKREQMMQSLLRLHVNLGTRPAPTWHEC